jgi:hypothetical protein
MFHYFAGDGWKDLLVGVNIVTAFWFVFAFALLHVVFNGRRARIYDVT